ncbi:SOS response-associated peptidase family protein [Halomonas daqiaonensis]|uniref:SOS response associated peptidase (SRAP) n=1 Tax=Halomonas daqiaonensis TaxID=650850 RepID=A0A1H7U034_9GAMM|nr:hypothetical protein SAMN04488129_1194 [Halomonas daqiaonensis]
MCGRFALFSDPTSIARALRLPPPSENWPPRYNIAPGTWITGVLRYSTDGDPLFDESCWVESTTVSTATGSSPR